MDDLNLVFDLLIDTAPKDRSRAIERYARAARPAPETDEALVLEAMRRARFSIISSVRRLLGWACEIRTQNVGANYPFERSRRFAGIQPNSGNGDCSRFELRLQLGP